MSNLQKIILNKVQGWLANPDLNAQQGLCNDICDHVWDDANGLVRVEISHDLLLKKYEEYSNHEVFPVPSPDPTRSSGNFYLNCKDMYEGDYGQSRLRLLKVLQEAKVQAYLDETSYDHDEWVVNFYL